jgi:hypothetical protein
VVVVIAQLLASLYGMSSSSARSRCRDLSFAEPKQGRDGALKLSRTPTLQAHVMAIVLLTIQDTPMATWLAW